MILRNISYRTEKGKYFFLCEDLELILDATLTIRLAKYKLHHTSWDKIIEITSKFPIESMPFLCCIKDLRVGKAIVLYPTPDRKYTIDIYGEFKNECCNAPGKFKEDKRCASYVGDNKW